MSSDMFLKLDGIEGESVDKDHAGEIDLLSWSWGMTQSGTTHMGTGGGAGKVAVQDLNFVHYVDKATANLMLFCCNGKHVPEAILTLRKAGENPLEYLVVTMTNCIVTSVSLGGSPGEERLIENVTLNFAEYKAEYQPQNDKGGKEGGVITAAWNIAENTKA